MSVLLPNSFIRYFSEKVLSTGDFLVKKRVTRSALFDLFCRNSNNVEDINHYFRDCIQHFLIQCRFGVDL